MITVFHCIAFFSSVVGFGGGVLVGADLCGWPGGIIGALVGAYVGLIVGRLVRVVTVALLRRS